MATRPMTAGSGLATRPQMKTSAHLQLALGKPVIVPSSQAASISNSKRQKAAACHNTVTVDRRLPVAGAALAFVTGVAPTYARTTARLAFPANLAACCIPHFTFTKSQPLADRGINSFHGDG